MNIESYMADALRTEKPMPQVVGNADLICFCLELMVSTATIADILKKHVVYGAPLDVDGLRSAAGYAGCEAETIRQLVQIGTLPAEVVPMHGRLLHAVLGTVGEDGELIEQMLGAYADGRPLDYINIAEEVGDGMWYGALKFAALREVQIQPDEVLAANIAKLKARFPDKFSLEASQARDTAAERAVLEGAL